MPSRWPFLLLTSSLCLSACDPDVAALVAPDAARDGTDGQPGPFGVTTVQFDVPARVSEAIPVVVAAPGDGVGVDDAGPYPAVVLVHGGLVAPSRYQWLANHLATRGYVVVMPETTRHLAIFRPDDGWRALEAVRARSADAADPLAGVVADDGPVATMGHSLGGVVAAMLWADHPDEVSSVAILASFPAASTDVEGRDGAVLSIIGSAEDEASIEGAWDGYQRFQGPGFFGIVDGMSHYDWTDAATAGELRRDGTPTRPRDDTRRDSVRVVDSFLDASLRDDASAWERLDAGFEHVVEAP